MARNTPPAGELAVATGDGKRYLALGLVEIDGKLFSKGDTVSHLDADRATALLAVNAIVEITDAAA